MEIRVTDKELNYCRQLNREGKVDECIKELRRLRRRSPNSKMLLFDLASVLLRKKGEFEEASQIYNLIISDRNKYSIYYEYAIYYKNLGLFTEALKYYNKLLEGENKHKCRGYYGIMMIMVQTGNFEEAYRIFMEAEPLFANCNFDIHLDSIKIYLKCMTGKKLSLEDIPEEADRYFTSQLLDYNDNATIDHIETHLQSPRDIFDKSNSKSMFYGEIDISKLYYDCKERIKDMKPTSYNMVDYYLIDLGKEIGLSYEGYSSTSVEVMTFPRTKDIITIRPDVKDHVYMRQQDVVAGTSSGIPVKRRKRKGKKRH